MFNFINYFREYFFEYSFVFSSSLYFHKKLRSNNSPYKTGNPNAPPEIRMMLLLTQVVMKSYLEAVAFTT